LIDQEKIFTSDSYWRAHDRCGAYGHYSYDRKIEPKSRAPWDPRDYGTTIHDALDPYHTELTRTGSTGAALAEAKVFIYARTRPRENTGAADRFAVRSVRTLALRTLERYSEIWGDPEWSRFKGEHFFAMQLEHPETLEAIELFVERGKRDGVVWATREFEWGNELCGPGLYLLETKVKADISDRAIRELKRDPQTILYAYGTACEQGTPVQGILWNLIGRPSGDSLEKRRAETQVEFEDRRKAFEAQALAGEIRGNAIRRRKAESDAEFNKRAVEYGMEQLAKLEPLQEESEAEYVARVDAWLRSGERFVRFVARPTPREIADARFDRWSRAKMKEFSLQQKIVIRNRGSACFEYGRPCDFLPLCDSGEDPQILETEFRQKLKFKASAKAEVEALMWAREEIANERGKQDEQPAAE
jgi:hypothetical protein